MKCIFVFLSTVAIIAVLVGHVRGTITVTGTLMRKAGGDPAFAAFVQRNAGKYITCGDIGVAVGMGDGSVRKGIATGNINRGSCSFDVTIPGKGVVKSVCLVNQRGVDVACQRSSGRHAGEQNTSELVEFAFTFAKIEMEHKFGKSMAIDDWNVSP